MQLVRYLSYYNYNSPKHAKGSTVIDHLLLRLCLKALESHSYAKNAYLGTNTHILIESKL